METVLSTDADNPEDNRGDNIRAERATFGPVNPCPKAKPAPLGSGRLTDETEAGLERLIAQTNQALDGPENRRRIAALAHLRAAVAAKLGDPDAPGLPRSEREDPYREDLERVMRPEGQCRENTPGPAAQRSPGSAPPSHAAQARIRPRKNGAD